MVSIAGIVAALLIVSLTHALRLYAMLFAVILISLLFGVALAILKRWPILSRSARALCRWRWMSDRVGNALPLIKSGKLFQDGAAANGYKATLTGPNKIDIPAMVSQIEQATQQNAALVEESTAALASVDQQVQGVNEVIAFFKSDAEIIAMPANAPRASKGARAVQARLAIVAAAKSPPA